MCWRPGGPVGGCRRRSQWRSPMQSRTHSTRLSRRLRTRARLTPWSIRDSTLRHMSRACSRSTQACSPREEQSGLDGGGMDSATLNSIARAVWRRWWIAALVVIAVMLADGLITARTPRTYQARAELLIGPSTSVDAGQLVYSVDALGRSMIVGTYANML